MSFICLTSSVLLLVGAQKPDVTRRQLYLPAFNHDFQQYYPPSTVSQFRQVSNSQFGGYAHTLARNQHTSIVVFGASWADNAHPRPKRYAGTSKGPPYYQGRYSNGIIWAEYLSNSLLTGEKVPLLDYAYGGAVANNNLTYTDKPDTSTQLDTYISDVRKGSIDRGNGRVLHFWWIGINQMTQIWTDAIKADSTLSVPHVLAHALDRVDKQIVELQRQITKARHDIFVNSLPCDFFIIPIPPMETVPTFVSQASDLAKNSTTLARRYVQVIGAMSHRYNEGILRFVSDMQMATNPSTSSGWVKTYDFERFWRDIIAHRSQYPQAITDTPCLNEVKGTQVICSHPEQYLYWDSLHPTTASHKVIAQSILPALNL